MHAVAATVCLWIAVITVAISVGGNVFQRAVIDPMWSGSPPGSVRAFSKTSLLPAIARFHLNPVHAVGLLCLLASPALAWNSRDLRNWLLLAVSFQVLVVLWTRLYFHPINRKLGLLGQARVSLPDAEIVALTRRWIAADRLRLALRFGTFLCLLRAMTLSGSAG